MKLDDADKILIWFVILVLLGTLVFGIIKYNGG